MAKYMYYPGCSMDGTGKAYHDSIEAVLPGMLGASVRQCRLDECRKRAGR